MNIKHRKDRNSTQFEVYIHGSRRRFGFRNLELGNKKWRRALEDLFEEVETIAVTGDDLSEDAWQTLLKIDDQPNSDVLARLIEYKVVQQPEARTNKNITLGEAFDRYYDLMMQTEWDIHSTTPTNWRGTAERLFGGKLFNRELRLADVTDELFVGRLSELKKGTDCKQKYSYGTRYKDYKNFKQLYIYWAEKIGIPNALRRMKYKRKPDDGLRVRVVEMVPIDVFMETVPLVGGAEKQALWAYYRLMGARNQDPKYDYWKDIVWENGNPTKMRRYCCKRKRKLEHLCPIDYRLQPILKRWHEQVVREHGKADGFLFPYLHGRTGRSVFNYFTDALKNHIELWPSLIQSLRVSRSREYRRLPNGRQKESWWIGHSEEVADEHYDGLEDGDFDAITQAPQPRLAQQDDQTAA